MFTAYLVVTLLTAAANTYAATADFIRTEQVLTRMTRMGIPPWSLFPLGLLKAAGALGLLAGIAIPPIGLAAAVGLVLFFVGAVITHLRTHEFATLSYPAAFLLLAAGALALRLATP